MRAQEFIVEGKSYKPFLEQLEDVREEARKEFVIARLTNQRFPEQADTYYKYMSKIVKAIDEAIATGKNPAARRIMRGVIPSNQVLRDAIAKDRATPSKQMWGTGTARQNESRRRHMWRKAVEFGMKVRRMLNFDVKLDKPPRPKAELEALLQRYKELADQGKPMPFRMRYDAEQELKRYNNES